MTTLTLAATKKSPASSGNTQVRDIGLLYKPKRILGMVLLLGLIIFIGELLVMFLLMAFPVENPFHEALIDSAILVVVVSPALYLLYYQPIRKRVDALVATKHEIRALTQRLMQVSEEEQRKLALDLHDEFGQTLSALRIEVDNMQQHLHRQAPDLAVNCTQIHHYLDEMRTSIHNIAARLRPSTLDDFGIEAALEGLIHDLDQQSPQTTFNLAISGLKRRPGPQIETVIYRICQEALTNAIRHAHATKIDIQLTSSFPDLIMTIRDNGQGFDMQHQLASSDSSKHLGIVGMRERANSAGGHFILSSHPDHGTVIRVVLPQQEWTT